MQLNNINKHETQQRREKNSTSHYSEKPNGQELKQFQCDDWDDWSFMGAIGLHAKLSASNHALIDRKVKLVDLFKTMELLNNRYAFYMLGRGMGIVTNSAHETPVYP